MLRWLKNLRPHDHVAVLREELCPSGLPIPVASEQSIVVPEKSHHGRVAKESTTSTSVFSGWGGPQENKHVTLLQALGTLSGMEFCRITGAARAVGDTLQIDADRFSGHYEHRHFETLSDVEMYPFRVVRSVPRPIVHQQSQLECSEPVSASLLATVNAVVPSA